ncbi:MAG: SDR family oxidoreductase [Pedobacter sp.]|nr:MAG: SDR family oxidoreductase [Pedobacter sp.]
MKIIVFGASGTVGVEIVRQALEKGYQVTAFVRNPDKIKTLNHKDLKVHKGDVLNVNDVQEALQNQDGVLCALGDGKIGKIRTSGTKNIVDAMSKMGIKRLICQTTLDMGESYQNLNFIWKHIMFGMLLNRAFKDHQSQEESIIKSNLDYTIVRPSALRHGIMKNEYKIGFDGSYRNLSLNISRTEVASFMISQLKNDEYLKKAVSISN